MYERNTYLKNRLFLQSVYTYMYTYTIHIPFMVSAKLNCKAHIYIYVK